ncbi:MAG: uncharacterized protein KVP18_003201 [Porospora cf. gigantea A]|uniref:uncharacterized protein n=1 Tax=Porospora cf. gigantea A TaxID=2853593 RepID=UPI00355ACCDD|nr:MAG: hypothetical protein KVP18_003201 [Porospora cf. gigantea A]
MASSTFLAATTMMFVNTDISNEWRMLMNLQFILLCLFVTGWLAMFWRRSRNLYLEGGWSFVRLCLRGVVYAVVMMLRDDSTSFTMTCLTTLLLVFKLARRHMYAVLLGGRSLTWKLAIPLWLVVFYLILAPIVYNVVKYTGVPWKGLNDYECLLVFPVLAIETGFMVSHLVIREPIRDRSRRQEMLSKAVDFTRKSILSHRTQETSKLARNTLSNFRRAAPAPIQHTTQNETTWVEAYDYYGSNNAGEDIPLIAEMDLEEAMCRWTLTYADKELETQFRSIYLEGTESWKWVTRVSLLLNLVAMLWQAALAVPYVPASFIVYIGFLLLSGVLACVVGLKSYRPAHIIWSFVFCLFFFLLWMTKAPVQGSPVLVGHKYLVGQKTLSSQSWPLVGEMQRILLVSSGAVYLFHAIHLLKQYDWGSSLALELHLLSVVPVLAYCIVMSSVW